MISSESKVLNNIDLRKLIFSFLRKYPKKACQICDKVCVWDKKVNQYIELRYHPWKSYVKILCLECQQSLNPSCIIN